MIVDTSQAGTPKMFITQQVASIDDRGDSWRIVFTTGPKAYNYRKERIRYYNEPERVDINTRGLYIRNRHITDIAELYSFGGGRYFHAVTNKGKEFSYDGRDVYVSRTSLDECGGNIWKFLNQLAAETGLELPEVGNILKMQYDIVDRKRDNVPLAQFVGSKNPLKTYKLPSTVIYPFGCNASQKLGVERALTNQVSIIQGPPGTGKTQTILNIIANLLIMGKTVLVVSNNNSAVENVAEKLSAPEVNLGFLIAQLGRRENKESFIANQPPLPEMTDWILENPSKTERLIRESLKVVAQGFEKQQTLAKLKIEREALRTETKYNQMQAGNLDNNCQWLAAIPSSKLLELKLAFEHLTDESRRPSFAFCIKWMWRIGMPAWKFFHKELSTAFIQQLESAYYISKRKEIETGIADCESFLAANNIAEKTADLRKLSLQRFKHQIAKKYHGTQRPTFTIPDFRYHTDKFLSEYPIVLSTTYAAKNCIGPDSVFDYVIMDEASQVDIATGALALSCATNAVIVGDDKQLPNVIDQQMMKALQTIESLYKDVAECYHPSTHSFLQSCCEVFKEDPQTLLREHYRCHPKIIEFCNGRFYDGQLITMTADKGEQGVIKIIRTPKGNHARGHYNQREIDVIRQEVLPDVSGGLSTGIISPYRNQTVQINSQLSTEIASTVHKFQGRECANIIMSMVDNELTEFSDDPNLLNVAISRAKDALTIVVTGNDISEDSNLGQLIAYANYNNFTVTESSLYSIFDLLYSQYTEQRLQFGRSVETELGELSENLMYKTLQEAIHIANLLNVGIICHYPLSKLIINFGILTEEEAKFGKHHQAHVDFLLYNTLTKRPCMAIEVDGWAYHHTEVQQARDKLKDSILSKIGLPLHRISTVQTITATTLAEIIKLK